MEIVHACLERYLHLPEPRFDSEPEVLQLLAEFAELSLQRLRDSLGLRGCLGLAWLFSLDRIGLPEQQKSAQNDERQSVKRPLKRHIPFLPFAS